MSRFEVELWSTKGHLIHRYSSAAVPAVGDEISVPLSSKPFRVTGVEGVICRGDFACSTPGSPP